MPGTINYGYNGYLCEVNKKNGQKGNHFRIEVKNHGVFIVLSWICNAYKKAIKL